MAENKMKNFDVSVEDDDLLDEELMCMPGLRVSKGPYHKPPKVETVPDDGQLKGTEFVCQQYEELKHNKQKAPATKTKNEVKPTSKKLEAPKDAEYEQVVPNDGPRFGNGLEQVKECAKSTVLFGGLSMLFFYWQQTGQMLHSAAFPSIIVCTLLAGISIGRIIGKHIK